jgi:hypothetical protein
MNPPPGKEAVLGCRGFLVVKRFLGIQSVFGTTLVLGILEYFYIPTCLVKLVQAN